MKTSILVLFMVALFACQPAPREHGQKQTELRQAPAIQEDTVPVGLRKLQAAYPGWIVGVRQNALILKDSTIFPYDDGIAGKSFAEQLKQADLEDQMRLAYPAGRDFALPDTNHDPGRVRHEAFFRKMYGNTAEEVRASLVPVQWLPGSINRRLWATAVNGVAEKLRQVSQTLDTLPHLHKYVDNPAGTFNWRTIAGTGRLSMHSFGIAIDINVAHSRYWKWDVQAGRGMHYQNDIPPEVVEVFERHGFIWGGKWYHYDTMHFEYRPEYFVSAPG